MDEMFPRYLWLGDELYVFESDDGKCGFCCAGGTWVANAGYIPPHYLVHIGFSDITKEEADPIIKAAKLKPTYFYGINKVTTKKATELITTDPDAKYRKAATDCAKWGLGDDPSEQSIGELTAIIKRHMES